MFGNLLNNASVKKIFMKQFEDIVKKENIKTIVININPDGTLGEVETHKEGIKIITMDEYNNLMKLINPE